MEKEMSNSVTSSGYSSAESSGNSSPDLESSGSRTSDPRSIDQSRLHERLSRIDQSESNISNSVSSPNSTPHEQIFVPESLKQTARDLSDDLMHHVVGLGRRKPPSKHAETLRRTSQELFNRHEIFFNNIASKMQIDRNTANVVFKNVADDMLADGRCNWGRIVALYAFGARLAKHVYATSSDKNERLVSQVGTFVGNYVVDKLSGWIVANGGWDAFDEHFPVETRMEDSVKRGLMWTAVGLGALAVVLWAR